MLFKSQQNQRERNRSLWPFRLDGWDISGRDNKLVVRTGSRHSFGSEDDERLLPTVIDIRSCGLRCYRLGRVHLGGRIKRGYCPPVVGIRFNCFRRHQRRGASLRARMAKRADMHKVCLLPCETWYLHRKHQF